ncbi:MAG TPA: sigma-70 family RNA polymerase sigma factor [Baekduia sp.]
MHAFRRYARSRDPALREELVARYLPLARHVACLYAGGREPLEDLVQVANLGLLKALDRFDPYRGTTFAAYAFPSIAGEVRRHFRDRGWLVKPPRGVQEQALLVQRATGVLACELNRAPTVGEIARRVGVGEEAVLEGQRALQARAAWSPPVSPEDRDESPMDRLGRIDDGFRRAEDRATLSSLCRILTPRDRRVLALVFVEDLPQAEVGRVVGLSQMQISRIVRAALEKLRAAAA